MIVLTIGMNKLEAMVKNGASLNKQTIERLDRIIQAYWQKAEAVKQFAIKLDIPE